MISDMPFVFPIVEGTLKQWVNIHEVIKKNQPIKELHWIYMHISNNSKISKLTFFFFLEVGPHLVQVGLKLPMDEVLALNF